MKYFKITLLFLSFIIFFTIPEATQAKTITVCASGCSYSTISQAEAAAVTGDILSVKNGTYAGFTVTKQITVEAETYDRVNPKNNATHINSQIYIQGGSWAFDKGPVIRGFHVSGLDPVRGKQTPYTLEYSFIEATGQGSDGVSFESAGGVIRGNHVEPGGDDCIDVDSQTTDILIENNYLKNCNQDGVEVRQQPNSISQRVTLIMINNRIEATGQDGLQIMDYNNFSNRRYILERNLFLGVGTKASGAGIGIMAADVTTENFSAAPMPEPLYAVNNTFVNGDAGISGGANLVAINNIFSGNTVFDLKNVSGKSKIMHSLFAAAPKMQGSNNLDNATTKTGNPLFGANYDLQSGSPAIDSGLARYQHTYSYDGSMGGSAQTYTENAIDLAAIQYKGSAPDLGWQESGGNPPPGASPTLSPTPVRPTLTGPTGSSKPGDANGDNLVDGTDYSIWHSKYNQSALGAANGDFDGSGFVDGPDYVIWLNNYNK